MTLDDINQLCKSTNLQDLLGVSIANVKRGALPGKTLHQNMLTSQGLRTLVIGEPCVGTPESEVREVLALLVSEAKKSVEGGHFTELDSAELTWCSTNSLHINDDMSEGYFCLILLAQKEAPRQVDWKRLQMVRSFITSHILGLNCEKALIMGEHDLGHRKLVEALEWGRAGFSSDNYPAPPVTLNHAHTVTRMEWYQENTPPVQIVEEVKSILSTLLDLAMIEAGPVGIKTMMFAHFYDREAADTFTLQTVLNLAPQVSDPVPTQPLPNTSKH